VNVLGAQPNAIMPRRKTLPPATLLIAMPWLTGCGMAGSEVGPPCPPALDYTAADQARAADEVEALSEGAVIVRWLGNYAVLRNQVRACR